MGCGASKQAAEGVVEGENAQQMTEVQDLNAGEGVTQSQTISSKGGIAFEITLEDAKKTGSLPSLQGAAAAADKLKNADAVFNSQAQKQSLSAQSSKNKLESNDDIVALKQRIEEKEAQASLNRQQQLEKLQEKLAKADEHAKEVQERKKNQSQNSLKDDEQV